AECGQFADTQCVSHVCECKENFILNASSNTCIHLSNWEPPNSSLLIGVLVGVAVFLAIVGTVTYKNIRRKRIIREMDKNLSQTLSRALERYNQINTNQRTSSQSQIPNTINASFNTEPVPEMYPSAFQTNGFATVPAT